MSDIANHYAEALFDLAREAQALDDVLDDMQKISEAFVCTPALGRLLSSHEVSREEKRALLDNCFGGVVHTYVLSCLKLMTDQGRIGALERAAKRFKDMYNEEMGILTVRVTAAGPLSDEQRNKLIQKLEAMTQKRIELTMAIDEACLGGIRLEYGGVCTDDTIRHRLDELKRQLQSAAV